MYTSLVFMYNLNMKMRNNPFLEGVSLVPSRKRNSLLKINSMVTSNVDSSKSHCQADSLYLPEKNLDYLKNSKKNKEILKK